MSTPHALRWARAAAAVLALETLGLAILAGWQVVALVTGDTAEIPTAIALLILTLVGVLALGGFTVAVLRDQSWGRSGGIVVQLLIASIALGAATGQMAHPGVALAIAVPAVLGFVLLVAAAREAAGGDPRGQD